MYKVIKRNFLPLFLAIVCACASLLFFMRLQLLTASVIDQALDGSLLKNLGVFRLVLLYVFLFEILNYIYIVFQRFFIKSTSEGIQKEFFSVLLNKSLADFNNISEGEIVAKFTSQINELESQFFMPMAEFSKMVLQSVFVVFTLYSISPNIAIRSSLIFGLALFAPKILESKVSKRSKDKLLSFEGHLEDFQNWLSSMELIKNFNISDKIFSRFLDSNDEYFKTSLEFEKISSKSFGLGYLVSLMSRGIIILYAAYLVLIGQLSPGLFFSILALLEKLAGPLFWMSKKYQDIIAAKPTLNSIKDFLSTDENSDSSGFLNKRKEEVEEKFQLMSLADFFSIVYDRVTFSYDDKPLIKDLTMSFENGKKYLIVGPSGCGKSSAIKLLLGHYPLGSGEISIDGHNIMRLENIRDYISYSSQEAVFFQDSLRDNLTLYSDIDDDLIFYYLNKLGLDKFSNKEALDSTVEEGGMNFSGGERKRLSLARSLLRKRPIMIFDEPLANIDPENLENIEDFLLSIDNSCVIIISHQFSEDKLSSFDRIYEFQGGKCHEKISF